jgi:Tol biopolymer transport system component/predicted Ser/Thr protein kinase
MTPQEWEKVSEIYHNASELESNERSAFLEKACGGDPKLRREVESLLAADGEAGNFISEPVVGAFASDLLKTHNPTPNEMIGHYRIISKIGSGGMGEVFLAVDTRLGRNVAIKTLSSFFDSDPNFLKRFRNEARAAATLNHPNVATVYSVDEHNGRPFIAMEYVEGKTLDHLFTDEGVDLATFTQWFAPVIDAIGQAHAKGVIHRDIKPGNIIVTEYGTPKILDFGLAYFQPTPSGEHSSLIHVTDDGQVIGTPSYMSPEQAEGKDIDHRTDIFSLGVVMYEALTGKRPFSGETNAEMITNLLRTEPIPATEVRPTVPLLVWKVVSRCLQKDRSDRPQTMKKVGTMLSDAVLRSNGAISAGSFARRLYHETRSGNIWLRVGAAALVVVLAVAAWFYFSRNTGPVNFATMTMRRLADTNNVGYSTIAPDGKSVAFATFDEEGTRSLWIRRIDDRNALQIVAPQRMAYWGGLAMTEDGGQVFYITAGPTAFYGTLYRVSSLGGPSKKLIEQANDIGGISPDGQRFLFVRYGDPNKNQDQSRIFTASTADGSGEQVVQSTPSGDTQATNFRDPQYSPDGRSVYYIKHQRIDNIEHWSLNVMPLDGGPETQILEQRERINEVAVLRDGSGLLITSFDPVSNLQQIYHVSLPEGKKTRVTNDLFFYFGVSVDREGRNIVASQRYDEQRVWVGEAGNLANLKPLNLDPAFRSVDWAPDGRIVYDALENNRQHVWIADADGKNSQRLTDPATVDFDPRVSGDGRYIVFTSLRKGFNQIWRMDIDGSNQVLLADVSGWGQTPRFESDGQTVVFDWMRELDRVLGRVPVSGGKVEEMRQTEQTPSYNPLYWTMSPDGKRYAYTFTDPAEGRTKVAIRDVGSSEPAHVLNIWPSVVFKWMPDGESIFYRERQVGYQPETEILKVDITTGKAKVLYSASPEYIMDMSFSRDGKKAALVRGRNISNSVLLTSALAK